MPRQVDNWIVSEEEGKTRGRKASLLSLSLRALGVIAGVLLVTIVDAGVFHVNSATAGFTFLVLILGIATRMGLRESITASISSVAAYNFFFLPPIGTFTIADPQNWVALCAFLATAITASRLSSSLQRKVAEASARQAELQQMYDFSRGLILGREDYSLADHTVKQIVESFGVENAWFYDTSTGLTSRIDRGEPKFQHTLLIEVAETGRIWRSSSHTALIVPVRLGGASLGSLGVAGEVFLSEVALQAIAQLVAIVIERARAQQIATRVEATQQNEQLKSTLLDALAHEFKTPLTSVKVAATTLLSYQLEAPEQRELFTIMNEEADRMTRLVSDSIELARMGTVPLTLHKEPCDAEELIRSALNDLHGLFDGRELTVMMKPDLPTIIADQTLSELALRQVLNNALKYSPVDTEIRVTAEADGSFVVVGVSDIGPGIAKADQERIFEKFYRGPDIRTQIPGTGMGLNITREIIEAQGGRIWVQSEAGKGATFFITLPLSSSPTLIEESTLRSTA